MITLKNRVRTARFERDLTLEQLSKKCGIGKTTINEVERGRRVPGVDVALLLAQHLCTTVENLFWLGDDSKDTQD